MEKNVTHDLKLKMREGKPVFGFMIGPGNEPEKTIGTLKDFGADFVKIENEHALVSKQTILEYIRAARKMDIPIFMRPEDKAVFFRCYLDSGLNGLMVPHVDTVEETVCILNQAYYPPLGHRGVWIAGNPYLKDFDNPVEVPFLALFEHVNNNTMVFPMIESLAGFSNLPRILALEGVTGTIVGHNDLALDMGGIDPKASRAEVTGMASLDDKIREIAKMCRDTGKVAGISGVPEFLVKWAGYGYQLFNLGYVVDGNVDSKRAVIEQARSLIR